MLQYRERYFKHWFIRLTRSLSNFWNYHFFRDILLLSLININTREMGLISTFKQICKLWLRTISRKISSTFFFLLTLYKKCWRKQLITVAIFFLNPLYYLQTALVKHYLVKRGRVPSALLQPILAGVWGRVDPGVVYFPHIAL